MTDEPDLALPFDDFPSPAIAYAVADGEPRIRALNGASEAVFGGVSSGMPVAAVFEQFGVVNPTGSADPVTHLRRGEEVGIYLDGLADDGPFFARTVPVGDGAGYLVLSNLSACLDVAEAPAVDHVSSVISHDLRNPLDVATAHLRAARETGDAEHFDAVADAHDRMEQIIRDVLTITRSQSAVDPSADVSVEAAAKDAWRSVDTEHATLEVVDVLPTATADADRLQRLFENLFRNAVEHGSTGNRSGGADAVEHGSDVGEQSVGQGADPRREVTVTVGAVESGFYVADDGPGIPSGEQNRVFEPGYSTRDDGTGLGLAIVDRVVAAHGWELTLRTATTGGARFEVRV